MDPLNHPLYLPRGHPSPSGGFYKYPRELRTISNSTVPPLSILRKSKPTHLILDNSRKARLQRQPGRDIFSETMQSLGSLTLKPYNPREDPRIRSPVDKNQGYRDDRGVQPGGGGGDAFLRSTRTGNLPLVSSFSEIMNPNRKSGRA
jgi:hypothetical protein